MKDPTPCLVGRPLTSDWHCACGVHYRLGGIPIWGTGTLWNCPCGLAAPTGYTITCIEPVEPDPIPDVRLVVPDTGYVRQAARTDYHMEHAIPVMLHWKWSKGYAGDPDTPDDPPHLEDVTVILGETDITDLLPADMLADVREAMLRDMEAGT